VNIMKPRLGTLRLHVGVIVIMAVVAGCARDGMHEVIGRVTDPSGAPLPGMRIVFIAKDKSLTATAETDAAGIYRLGVRRPGEGSPDGEYTVLAIDDVPNSDSAPAPAPKIAARYSDPALSGLEAHVKPGRNRFDFQLDPQ